MSQFYAQPYDLDATGFYFETAEDYAAKAAALRNRYGAPVEEFEIQFIDGEAIDAELAQAVGLYQNTIAAFIACAEAWDEDDKRKAIIATAELGAPIALEISEPEQIDIDLYEGVTMRELAEQFVDDGLFGDIPDSLASYIDYDAIARDLAMDYGETVIAGVSLIYRSA